MIINNNNGLAKYGLLISQTQEGASRTDKVGSSNVQKTTGSRSARSDAVELSSRSINIQHIKSSIENVSDVREDRIKALTEALAKGELNLNGHDIADRILLDPGHNAARNPLV